MPNSLHLLKTKNWLFDFCNVRCEVKEFGHPGSLYTKPKAHAEEEEMPEDEWRKFKLPSSIAEDNNVLNQPRL